ncbi:hypothetical protein LEP1GSC034_2568 [Leptospira interrogans str. 2003000735]|uniref:Leucine rich repeat protein n=3 Tax=Leptospira interrogans TaxID=173 RepID=A0A829CXW4_LEPIR|nr:hypothetical protein LEP1GSC027_1748 [Leptospira interrogans str. 2002000624]EKQ40160.1 hypothetical protein LEP1GSC025_2123 [Leptospira interrogans str. 2002000621]EKQ45951.1 hypothetical protein LEP1GSC026_2574 [Leptospira interrogans str. 2002000623]EMJ73611.1 hypothetical protein LEP1GSC033_3763 [Leptospira interrogans str. 2002000632]EMJ74095.1 hypothetical protein LEP1GSC034_2568 [Leptospira interrogans str. 2003000735]EMJ78441.1 hypothetical protein LEP1GSC032_3442 [Leptospira interr
MSNNVWIMVDEKQKSAWQTMPFFLEDPHVISWNQIPEKINKSQITLLRIFSLDDTIVEIPECIHTFSNLIELEIPRKFIFKLENKSLPSSLKTLCITGSGQCIWPQNLNLPAIDTLKTGGFVLRFTHSNFNGLKNLILKLDKNATMLNVIQKYRLNSLGLTNVNKNEIFEKISLIGLNQLGIAIGRIESLSGITNLNTLKILNISNLPRLSNLSEIRFLPELEELSIQYCNQIKNPEIILELTSLRKLEIVGCKNIGLNSIKEKINSMNLEELSILGSS